MMALSTCTFVSKLWRTQHFTAELEHHVPHRTCLLALDEVQHVLSSSACHSRHVWSSSSGWRFLTLIDGPLYELAPLSLFRRVREICDKRPKHGWEVDREAYVVSRVFPIVDAIWLYIFRYK